MCSNDINVYYMSAPSELVRKWINHRCSFVPLGELRIMLTPESKSMLVHLCYDQKAWKMGCIQTEICSVCNTEGVLPTLCSDFQSLSEGTYWYGKWTSELALMDSFVGLYSDKNNDLKGLGNCKLVIEMNSMSGYWG